MIHFQLAITTNSTKAHAKPRNATQRGKMAVRNPMVQVENMKTAAIFMANRFSSASLTRRLK